MSTLIDAYMPRWDVRERHRITVHAPPDQVYAAIRETDLAAHPLVRVLFALRGIPALLTRAGRRKAARASRTARLADFERNGFAILAEHAPRDLLIGLEGRFWTPAGGICTVDADAFREPIPPGRARAAWDFRVEPGPNGCLLTTETRVLCADAPTRRRFLAYWALVRPGSGLIRRMMLGAIRAEAEGGRRIA